MALRDLITMINASRANQAGLVVVSLGGSKRQLTLRLTLLAAGIDTLAVSFPVLATRVSHWCQPLVVSGLLNVVPVSATCSVSAAA